jgi:hypothetical protein
MAGDPGAQGAGQAMVEHRGARMPSDDGQRLLEARRQDEGQQLGLVADFGQCDDNRAGSQRQMTTLLPGQTGGYVVKGLAKSETACTMIMMIKYVDASTFD